MQDPDGHAIDDARRTGKAPGMATAPPFTAPLLRLKHTASSTPAVLQCEGLQSHRPWTPVGMVRTWPSQGGSGDALQPKEGQGSSPAAHPQPPCSWRGASGAVRNVCAWVRSSGEVKDLPLPRPMADPRCSTPTYRKTMGATTRMVFWFTDLVFCD